MTGWSLEYSFDVDPERAIVYEKIFGIWKVETAKKYHADFQREIEPLIHKPWVKLIDLHNWKTSYPEVVRIIGDHLSWCRQHNMVMSLNVLNNPSTFRQLHQMFAVGSTKDMSQTFRSMAEAEKYLQENWFDKLDQK